MKATLLASVVQTPLKLLEVGLEYASSPNDDGDNNYKTAAGPTATATAAVTNAA
jgi:hypothetical protein